MTTTLLGSAGTSSLLSRPSHPSQIITQSQLNGNIKHAETTVSDPVGFSYGEQRRRAGTDLLGHFG